MHAECSLERIYGGVDEASTIISATVCLWFCLLDAGGERTAAGDLGEPLVKGGLAFLHICTKKP